MNQLSPIEAAAPDQTVVKSSGLVSKRLVILCVVLVGLCLGLWQLFSWWTVGRFMVTTDDAYIAADMSALSAKIAGYIVEMPVANNRRVKAGDLLARIDDGDYRIALDAARARLATQDATIARIGDQFLAQSATIEQTLSQIATAEATLRFAHSDLERAQRLGANDFASRARIDQAMADNDKAIAGLASARAVYLTAQKNADVLKAQKLEAERQRAELVTAVDRAQRDLTFAEVRAPFDGVIGNRAAQVGQFVQGGTRLMALIPLDFVRVEANLKETQLARVKPGQKVSVSVDSLGGQAIEGRVESISPATGSQFSLLPPDNATGNFTKIVQRVPVRIALPAEVARKGVLAPGMSVVVTIDTRDDGARP